MSLGKHALQGLSQPERVYQPNAADLPSQFPPLGVKSTDLQSARRGFIAAAVRQSLTPDAASRRAAMRMPGIVTAFGVIYLVLLALGWWTNGRHGGPAFDLAPSSQGVVITDVVSNGPADQAGLRAGATAAILAGPGVAALAHPVRQRAQAAIDRVLFQRSLQAD